MVHSGYDRCGLFLVKRDGCYGFIDRAGEVAFPVRLSNASRFAGGMAAVAFRGRWGYISTAQAKRWTDRHFQVDFEYDYCADFSGGLGAVLKDGKWGYVDQAGKLVVPPRYTSTGCASEGMGPFQVGGKPIFDGEMVVGGKWGFVNTKGEVVIKPRFRAVKVFNNGLARVNVGGRVDDCGHVIGGRWATIDKTGRFVQEPTADAPENAPGSVEPKRAREQDSPKGSRVRWRRERRFHDGLARARTEDGKVGFVNRKRKLVIKPRFDDAGRFSEGRAPVSIGGYLGTNTRMPFGKTAYIDKRGRLITRPMFDRGDLFFDGLAQVHIGCELEVGPHTPEGRQVAWLKGGRWGYINRAGKMVWEPSG